MTAPPPESPPPSRDESYTRRVVIAVVITLLSLALALLAWYGLKVLLIGFAGILLAILLRGIAMGVAYVTRLAMGWALGITFLLLAGGAVATWLLIWPSLVEQTSQLVEKLPAAYEKLSKQVESTGWGKQLIGIVNRLNPMDGQNGSAERAMKQATNVVSITLAIALNLVVVLFLGIYLAIQPKLYIDGLSMLFPPVWRPRVCEILTECGANLRWWLIAQGIDMVIVGAATALGLWLIGVPLALTLGLLAAIFNFIPNFGPLISFIPAVLLALVDDPNKALQVTIFYIVLQSVEGYLLMPLLQRGAVDSPPALLIAGQVLLALLAGGLGLALAAPLLVCAMVIIKMAYLHDAMGDAVKLSDHTEPAPARKSKKSERLASP